jgi:broad specificity phosphatase PhoE
MPHELYLLRHGETEWNREGRIQGSQDSPLTARGRAQATAQADILAREVPQMWQLARYCSPLRRARDTARIALDGLVPVIDRRLREVDFGAWEGLTPAERGARDPWPICAQTARRDGGHVQDVVHRRIGRTDLDRHAAPRSGSGPITVAPAISCNSLTEIEAECRAGTTSTFAGPVRRENGYFAA